MCCSWLDWRDTVRMLLALCFVELLGDGSKLLIEYVKSYVAKVV